MAGHGSAWLSLLEDALSHDDIEQVDNVVVHSEDGDGVDGYKLERTQLWMDVCRLLVDAPHLRTTLQVPAAMHDTFWSERWHHASGYKGPMCRARLRQTKLDSRGRIIQE